MVADVAVAEGVGKAPAEGGMLWVGWGLAERRSRAVARAFFSTAAAVPALAPVASTAIRIAVPICSSVPPTVMPCFWHPGGGRSVSTLAPVFRRMRLMLAPAVPMMRVTSAIENSQVTDVTEGVVGDTRCCC